MAALTKILSDLVADAFRAEGLDPAHGHVTTSDRPDLAQFQCNGALAAAKAAKANPRAIAEKIMARLQTDARFSKLEIAGPGFINLSLTDAAIAAHTRALRNDPRCGVPETETPKTIIIDYGGPNIAKTMHVGHLRSLIIGDALKRLHRFVGDKVIGDVHFGDWGLQMGQLINEVKLEQPNLPYFDASFTGPYPEQSPVSMDDLGRLYPVASSKSKTDEARRDEDRKATQELQSGRPGYRALWQHFCNVTRVGLERECISLGVRFDLWKGESHAEPFVPALVEDLKARGIAELDAGAWIIRVARETDKKEMPPIILVNRDGAIGYHGSDLGTIVDRKQGVDPQLSLYVVDQRQALHFEQVFRASDRAGLMPESTLEHVGFGTVNGPDGKPYKTRDGGTLKLQAFINQADEVAMARMKEAELGADVSEAEQQDIAHKVAVAAVKFSDLSNVRTTNYIFDLDRFISFEGKTGPYLLYAAVRIKSLARRADAEGVKAGPITIELDAERALVLALDGFNEALRGAYDKRMPHILCDHTYTLAQAFSAFYAAAPILVESDAAKKASRFSLAMATLKQLELALGLIGIETPERM
jgi:arginyl-tRNA synthetase